MPPGISGPPLRERGPRAASSHACPNKQAIASLRPPSVRNKRVHAAAAANSANAAAAAERQAVLRRQESALLEWLRARGGYVHPSLRLADPAPCGARGVVAAAPITLDELDATGPVVCVPAALHLNGERAAQILREHALLNNEAASATAAAVDAALGALDETQRVAAAAALLRRLGRASPWWPYIESLPEAPPSPWLLLSPDSGDSGELDAAIEAATAGRAAADTAGWRDAVVAYGARMRADAADAAAALAAVALAAAASPGLSVLSADDVLWGVAMVRSRSLSAGGAAGLLPYVDLINHSPDARPPMLTLLDDDDGGDGLAVTVLPMRGDEAAPLKKGEELCIAYAGSFTPLEAFCKFGFVPHELW